MENTADIEVFYNTFREVSKRVHASTDLKEVLDLVVSKATEALHAQGAILRILNLDTDELELSAAHNLSAAYLAKGPLTRKKLITELYQHDQIVVIDDIRNDPRIQYPREVEAEGIRMVLDCALRFRNHIAGILRIYFGDVRPVSEDEREFLVSLADQCAIAIEKARLIEDQKCKYDHLALQTEKLSALGRMAAGIAHEINNPLAGILLYSSNLFKKAPVQGPLKEGLGVIMRETLRCKVIIQELLEFARDREPRKAPANITTILQKSMAILENEFRLRHIQIEKDFAPAMQDSCFDANQLEQVFVNLLLNAAQAIEENGRITIRSRIDAARREVAVDIIDTGCGIAPEHMEKIFEPFFSTKKNGSGLGLAVSFGIVKNHGGRLEASSEPGRGSRFTVVLPLTAGHPAPGSHG
jgi:signal transduction histidine kinase